MPQPDSNQHKEDRRLERQFESIERSIPDVLSGMLNFLRRPMAILIRIPLGILFTLGGVLAFLPVLGIWMLPLGLLLLAIDLAFLRRPVARNVVRIRHYIRVFARRKASKERAKQNSESSG